MQKYLYLAAAFLLPFFVSAQPVITGATRVKLFKGDSIFTASLSSLTSAVGGGNRPDSAFATGAYNSPVYWQKSVESNIWKSGTLSIRTADTTAVFNIKDQGPYGNVRKTTFSMLAAERSRFGNGAFANGSIWDVSSIDANAMRPNHYPSLLYGVWREQISIDSTTNLAIEKPGNHIRNVGFNIDGAASWLPKWYWSTEQAYYPGAGNSGGLDWEHHLEVVDTLNRLTRPFNLNGSHNGNKYSAGFRVNEFYVGRPHETDYGLRIKLNTGEWSTDKPFTFKINNSTRVGPIIDRLHWGTYKNVLDFENNGRLAVGDSAGVKILNRLELNRVNAGAIKIISKTDPNIVIDSTMLTINSTDVNNRFLILTKPGTANAIGFALSSTDFYVEADYSTRNFILSRTAPSNSFVISSTGRVGLGISNPFSAIDVVQPTNSLSGGILLRPTTGNYCGLFVDGSNRLAVNRGGSDRLYLSDVGQLTIPSYNSVSSYPITPVGVLGFDANGVIGTVANGSSLPSGTSSQTLRYDATNTLVATSQITNDGSTVGIGTAPNASYELDVAGKTRAQGLRAEGTSMQPSLELANTTPSTGKTFTLGSSNTGNFYLSSDVAGDAITVAHATGDVTITPKLKLTTLGSTATALLGRNASNEASSVTIGSGLSLSGGTLSATGGSSPTVITPAQITATQNDYAPTDFSTANVVRISSNTTEIWGITGFSATGISSGAEKKIINVGSTPIYLAGEHPSSTAANRLSVQQDIVLGAKQSVTIIYDGTASRWIVEGNSMNPHVFHNWAAASATVGDWGIVSFNALNAGSVGTVVAATNTTPVSHRISTASASNGGGSICITKSVASMNRINTGHFFAECYISTPSPLSDGTNGYTAGLSYANATTSTFTEANSMGIKYTHTLNSGKWTLYAINSGGTATEVDLGVTVAANTAYRLRLEGNDEGTEVRAYINGEMKGVVSTNLPSTTANLMPRIVLLKSAGTSTTLLECFSFQTGLYAKI